MEKLLSQDVSKNVVKAILAPADPSKESSMELRSGIINFVLIQVQDSDVDEAAALIGKVCDVLSETEFVIYSMESPLVIATLGFPFYEPKDPSSICEAATRALM